MYSMRNVINSKESLPNVHNITTSQDRQKIGKEQQRERERERGREKFVY
jgi:hypothetical protein